MKTSLAHWPVKQWYTFADYYLSLEFIYKKMSTHGGIHHQHAPPLSVSFPPDVNCPADIYTCIKSPIKVKAFPLQTYSQYSEEELRNEIQSHHTTYNAIAWCGCYVSFIVSVRTHSVSSFSFLATINCMF